MLLRASLLLLIGVGSDVLGCKPFEVAGGKRLLEVKASFGRIFNQCRKEIHKVMRIIPRDEFPKRMAAFCELHNSCSNSLEEASTLEVLDCWAAAYQNKTNPFYSSVTGTEEVSQAAGQLFACLRNTEAVSLPLQVMDDLVSVGRQYVYTIG
ncbi:uncharacterized protein LOC144151796 [Haemaphysalis longicornis]